MSSVQRYLHQLISIGLFSAGTVLFGLTSMIVQGSRCHRLEEAASERSVLVAVVANRHGRLHGCVACAYVSASHVLHDHRGVLVAELRAC